MLNAEKILKLMDEYKFDDVRKLCLSEIAAKMNKEKGGKSAEKAVKAMEKYVKQRCKKLANSALHGWFKVDVGIESYYCVCDGMTAILLNPENIADLPFESAEGMNVAQCFPPAWESFEKIEIKEELKAVHKNARNFTKTFSWRGSKGILVKFGDMAIDTERMVDVVSTLGSGTLFKNPNNKGACVYESDLGIGLILPLEPKKEDDIKQYSEYVEMIKSNL